MTRDDRIYEEAAALWRQMSDQPVPDASGAELLGMIVGGLHEAEYNRLASPQLRPANITMPRG